MRSLLIRCLAIAVIGLGNVGCMRRLIEDCGQLITDNPELSQRLEAQTYRLGQSFSRGAVDEVCAQVSSFAEWYTQMATEGISGVEDAASCIKKSVMEQFNQYCGNNQPGAVVPYTDGLEKVCKGSREGLEKCHSAWDSENCPSKIVEHNNCETCYFEKKHKRNPADQYPGIRCPDDSNPPPSSPEESPNKLFVDSVFDD